MVTILAVTPYLAIRLPQAKVWVARLIRHRHREDFLYVLNESTDLIANYMVGTAVISLIAGVISFAGFQIIGVRFALVLAAWVAFTDLIPAVGAFIGAAGVAAVTAFQGPGVVIAAVGLLLVYQLLENFVIAPRVMNRAVDLSPVGVIVAILIGGSLAGLFGALLALPIAAMTKIIVFELLVPERVDEVRKDRPPEGIERSRRRAQPPTPVTPPGHRGGLYPALLSPAGKSPLTTRRGGFPVFRARAALMCCHRGEVGFPPRRRSPGNRWTCSCVKGCAVPPCLARSASSSPSDANPTDAAHLPIRRTRLDCCSTTL